MGSRVRVPYAPQKKSPRLLQNNDLGDFLLLQNLILATFWQHFNTFSPFKILESLFLWGIIIKKRRFLPSEYALAGVARQSGLLGHYLSCNENLCCDTFPPVAVVCENIIDTACDFLATRVTSIPRIHTAVRQTLVYQISRRVNDFHVAVAS